MKVFSAARGWRSRKRKKKKQEEEQADSSRKGAGAGPEHITDLSDTESLEQEPDSPMAASLPDKSRESDRLGKSKSD